MTSASTVVLPSYLRVRRRFSRRWLALGLIALLHVLALMLLMRVRESTPPKPAATLMVSLITTAPPEQKPPPPKPRPKIPDKPQMIATTAPLPSEIQAPPMEALPEPEPPPAMPSPALPPQLIPPNFVAAYLNNPAPSYPAMSVRLREEGTVILLVHVSVDGRAEQVQVEHSSGSARLDDAATSVVKNRWRFVPAKQGDQPVAAWVRIPLSFELKKN